MNKQLAVHIAQLVIGGLFILVFASALYFVIVDKTAINENVKDIALILVGVLATNTTQVINYFFGSSSGSKDKTEQLRTPGKK